MENQVSRSKLLNAPAGGDVVNSGGVIRIKGLDPINTADFISVTKVVAAAEVVQVVTIALTAVVVAERKYQIKIGNTGTRREGAQNQLMPYGYTAPAILTGSAATDRHNLYVSIANKINNDPSNFSTAYPIISVDYDTQTVNYTVGAVATGGTSGATGIILADADAGATGTLTIALMGTTLFVNNELITDSSGGSASANIPTQTLGIGLRIVDDAGYYPPYTVNSRKGANAVILTQGFNPSTDYTLTTAAVYSQGIGSRMTYDVPVNELTSGNLAKGFYSFPISETVDISKTYTLYVVLSRPKGVSDSVGASSVGTYEQVQNIWANDAAGGYAAFDAAMLALP